MGIKKIMTMSHVKAIEGSDRGTASSMTNSTSSETREMPPRRQANLTSGDQSPQLTFSSRGEIDAIEKKLEGTELAIACFCSHFCF
jgi:hypothetical protein